MARNDTTSALIDGMLRSIVVGGSLSLALIAPNLIRVLDKPTRTYFKSLDRRAQERELRRLMEYIYRRGLVTEKYEHGLELTAAGKRRLQQVDFDNLTVQRPTKWDHRWRLVLFDIPATKNANRILLTTKLRLLGFQLLQQSAWTHPYSCRGEIEIVCNAYGVNKYVTYLETSHIDHENLLVRRFNSMLNPK
jgi:DNA-binding transcriptional regulator PaaX